MMDRSPEHLTATRSQLLTPGAQAQPTQHSQSQSQLSSSHSSSRRTSNANMFESLPSPPPDPRQTDNIFKFPSVKEELPAGYHKLFNYVESIEEFYKTLNKIIANDCRTMQEQEQQQQSQQQEPHSQSQPQSQHERDAAGKDHQQHCAYCHQMQQECAQFIDPLHNRLGGTLSALLAAHGAVEQLSRLYAMWDKYLDVAANWRRQRERLNYVNLLNEKAQTAKEANSRRQQHQHQQQQQKQQQQQQQQQLQQQHQQQFQQEPELEQYSDTEADVEQSIALIESILAETAPTTPAPSIGGGGGGGGTGAGLGRGVGGGSGSVSGSNNASMKRGALKQQRERSKSFMFEDAASTSTLGRGDHERDVKSSSTVPQMLRRQSTYSEGKSKVSKWTKVKAAFKWERANVPALIDSIVAKDLSPNGVGLTPVNTEVARYLRVPSMPGGVGCGGSSADSILSSSSGHLLSEIGTPGTISSASSMDDIDSSCRNTLRRDSTKSDSRVVIVDNRGSPTDRQSNRTDSADSQQKSPKIEINARCLIPSKPSSIKSLRKSKNVNDFEVLPEDVVADLKSSTQRRTKMPPSPLNLNLKQDFNDSEFSYSPYSLKSPKDGTQSLNRSKKINSPGNSSVPSSPSRHSDFFAEFESEDLSSGDFSEPSSPKHLDANKSFSDSQQEINQHYQMLRIKLEMEFEAKRREWEKMKSNTNACRAITLITPPKPEEHHQHPVFNNYLSAKALEENLTPDFKKKLRKWRVKKQISIGGAHAPTSPTRDSGGGGSGGVGGDVKPKIDWNLWKTGQLKLEGQGLTSLPDQKDLPEEFQKKLEQWNKIKRGGGGSASAISSGHDSIKRSGKHAESVKKSADHKPHEKDKLEKLAKLKAIVTDHPAKEIEVKTSEGVMKFEGISRKFTRKLYEWEKARGIGPESSTFALLHPGYRPIVVDRITKENNTTDNSPTLSRSFSLDSIAQGSTLPGISQQASSLSLNDVNELINIDNMGSSDVIGEHDFKKYDEPEAVMIEVEDHIEETASPLITAHTLVEQQTPIYKYEEVSCNDYCNTRRVQSFESHTNLAPILSVLQRADEIFTKLKRSLTDMEENAQLRQCEMVLAYVRSIYPYYSDNLMKPNVLNAISDVQGELSRLADLSEKSPLDEACCREMIEERDFVYNEELGGLHETLELLKRSILGGTNFFPKEIVPDINITAADAQITTNDTIRDQASTTLEATDEWSASHAENYDAEAPKISQRTQYTANNGANGAAAGTCKKKLRLRKTGSRQNSKTESDSSDEEAHNILETPRRIKRKNFRLKQRSFDDDYRRHEGGAAADDVIYMLKVRPGHLIEQSENVSGVVRSVSDVNNYRVKSSSDKCLVETAVQPQVSQIPLKADEGVAVNVKQNANNFAKTKRKMFIAVAEPSALNEMEQLPQESKATAAATVSAQAKPAQQQKQSIVEIRIEELDNLEPKEAHSKCKSLSQGDVRTNEFDYDDQCRCQSEGKLAKASTKRAMQNVREPLASDSYRVINTLRTRSLREMANTPTNSTSGAITDNNSPTQHRKEHRFKKNTDKSHHYAPFMKSQSATIKKIETKIAKTHSGASLSDAAQSPHSPHDKYDNVLPLISRKLERQSLTPTPSHQLQFDSRATTPNSSEPTTPLLLSADAPRTPLSERAQRLQKAKEDFLQNTLPHARPQVKRRDDIVRNETWEQYRRSDYSMSSTAGEDGDGDGNLPKSFSVDTITADSYTETPTHSDAGTDLDSSVYDSLPRAVSRSGKISSKLGFATLASKFRRVKGNKKNKDAAVSEPSKSTSALSALCRQTLLADVIAGPQLAGEVRPAESVKKSQSSPQAGRGGGGVDVNAAIVAEAERRRQERLNKSQSEQYVKRLKESLV